MDTTPPLPDTLTSTSFGGGGVNVNQDDIEDKDAEMSQIDQSSSNCNNMNINKRVRQMSGRLNVPATSVSAGGTNISHNVVGHRVSAVSGFGLVGSDGLNNADPSDVRDHRMSVSDSGDSEPPRLSDLDSETVSVPTVAENIGPSGASVVSSTEVLESDGDVRSDDEEDDEVNQTLDNI